MRAPPHPGLILRRECLEPLGLTVTEAALRLGVPRTTLSELLAGRRGISPDMAARIAETFGGSPETWIGRQLDHASARKA
jgi:addiction module HigA family antidote